MSYYNASGIMTKRRYATHANNPNLLGNDGEALNEPFLNYLWNNQVFVEPRIDLFTKSKFMQLKQKRINRR